MKMNTILNPATLLVVGAISGTASAADLTNRSNEFRNELAMGYQFGFNETYHVALEVFGQKKPTENRVNNHAYELDEQTPVDTNELWGLNDGRADLDWATGVRLRPGYNVTQNTRIFLDGGVVWGDFNMELTDSSNAVGAAQFDTDTNANDLLRGIRYGAGLEHHLQSMNNLSLVLDYSMTEFDAASSDSAVFMNASDSENNDELAPAYQQIMLSVRAEFNPGFIF